MGRIRTAAAATLLAVAVTGCSGTESAPDPTSTTVSTTEPVTTTVAPTTTTSPPTTTTAAPTTTAVIEPEPVELVPALVDALAATEETTVHFALASSQLDATATAILADVAETLRANSGVTVLLTGHTDASGADRTNRDLSIERAQAVRTWLIEEGSVFPGFLEIDGRGDRQPVADNTTEDGQAANRRTDISVAGPRERGLVYSRWEDTDDAGVVETRPPDFVGVTGGAYGQAGSCSGCVIQIEGLFTGPRTGTYTLALASGGTGSLSLSPSQDSAGLVPIVETETPAAYDDFAATSDRIELEQGVPHAMRATVVIPVDGSDHVFLGWSAGGRRVEQMSARAVSPQEQ